MEVKLLDLTCVQLARLLGLVKAVEPVALEGEKDWALLIRGRGFTRLLKQDVLFAPNLMRPASWALPRPKSFPGRRAAVAYARSVGLLPAQRTWAIRAE